MLSAPAAASQAVRDRCVGGAGTSAGLSDQAAALFSPLAGARGLLLAVSGGPDSVALLRLAAHWQSAAAPPPLHVATVDHRLRPESDAEAAAVAGWAAAVGLPHSILVWDGPKPSTRIQEAARDARYGLLAAKAADLGFDHVVTAHHADDQAETILFRLVRGSGLAGLAGMAPLTAFGAVTIARPLLGLAKVDLVNHCVAIGQPFVEDPSNADTAYARTRMRHLGRALAREGLDRTALLRLARRAQRMETALAPQVAAAVAALGGATTADGCLLDAEPLAGMPEEIALRALGRVIGALAPGRRLRLERLEHLVPVLQHAVRRGTPFAATLGGVLIRLDRTGRLALRPEPPRRRGRAAAFDGLPV